MAEKKIFKVLRDDETLKIMGLVFAGSLEEAEEKAAGLWVDEPFRLEEAEE